MGAGPLVLTGNEAYTGGTTINSGGLLVMSAGGNLNSITGSIVDNGTLAFAHSNGGTFANSISSSGVVVNSALYGNTPPQLTLSGTNTYSGGTTINEGRILLNAGNTIGTSPITITNGVGGTGGIGGTANGQVFIQSGTVTNCLSIAGPAVTEAAGNFGAIRLNGVITGNVNLTGPATIDSRSHTGTVFGQITGGAGSLLNIGDYE